MMSAHGCHFHGAIVPPSALCVRDRTFHAAWMMRSSCATIRREIAKWGRARTHAAPRRQRASALAVQPPRLRRTRFDSGSVRGSGAVHAVRACGGFGRSRTALELVFIMGASPSRGFLNRTLLASAAGQFDGRGLRHLLVDSCRPSCVHIDAAAEIGALHYADVGAKMLPQPCSFFHEHDFSAASRVDRSSTMMSCARIFP